jgi:curved DNA-binding protein CbpA
LRVRCVFGEVWIGKVRLSSGLPQIPHRVDDNRRLSGKRDPKACLMQNLYDLLGVRPDDDAETIKKAFRAAAKASHPDHHGGDPEAAARFRQISKAYEILRDAEQRAAYDRLLEFERRPLRHKVKRSMSDMKRHVVRDSMVGVLLAAVLVLGYELFTHIPGTPGNGAAGVTALKSAQAAADHPAERIGAVRGDRPERMPAPQMPIVVPTAPAATASAANDGDRPEMMNGEPVSNPGQTISVARRDSESDVPAGAGAPTNTEGEPPLRHDAPSLDAPSAAAEERNIVPAADDRRDGKTPEKSPEKTPEPAGANAGGMKPPEIAISARTPAAAKRHTPSRPRFEQAALENRNTPAPDNSPSRLFGAGF